MEALLAETGNCSSQLALPPSEAHIWYAWTADCDTPALRAYYRSLLNEEECARLERFAFEYLKLEYLATRALCRTVLSAYASVSPAHWQFEANSYGRPEIATSGTPAPLRFNLSNARSLVACVVTREVDAGIDVEELDRRGETVSIANHYFSPLELHALHALPPERQRHRFFELWTLKESYIKARGMGLSIPLDQFSFCLEAPPISVILDPRLGDIATDWQFQLYRLSDRHLVAVCIRRAQPPDFRIHIREVVPDTRLRWRNAPCGF
ncbi:MAG: 4'-phosphopantetheinyl transferase superfamily protein [Sinobacteraceae bacterium]|nr:4'-phosphopantetheinyl transferase superfamily protein [Nevskiaceae bacterium]